MTIGFISFVLVRPVALVRAAAAETEAAVATLLELLPAVVVPLAELDVLGCRTCSR